MFIDEVGLTIRAGKGGDGRVAFFPQKHGPCGGDGGNGGNVYVMARKEVKNLNKYAGLKEICAESGFPGENYHKTGKDGRDTIVLVPLQTEVHNTTKKTVFTVQESNKKYLLCRGGSGGRGNDRFKSPTNRTPKCAEKGFLGEIYSFTFVLKLIADIGLIGLPNAGKSTLLNLVTNANVRTAPYPFTTLEPNLGACCKMIIADIPGLIEGASRGRGLGIQFLKHIEKVKVLVHCISLESSNLVKDYQIIRKELASYNTLLEKKPEIVLFTKSDLISNEKELQKRTKQFKEKVGKQPISISLFDPQASDELSTMFNQAIKEYL